MNAELGCGLSGSIKLETHFSGCINEGDFVRGGTLINFFAFFIGFCNNLVGKCKRSQVLFRQIPHISEGYILTTFLISDENLIDFVVFPALVNEGGQLVTSESFCCLGRVVGIVQDEP